MTKKILFLIISLITSFFIITVSSYAISLPGPKTDINKTIVHPDEEVTVTVTFGTNLGAYTFDFAYDNNLLQYVRTSDGQVNDNGTRVRVTYYDTTGGSNSKSSMNITFKAKNVITSNPTQINITAEGLSNATGNIRYDDITTPITKQLTVEPVYDDYKIDLQYEGDIIENEEKEMKLLVKSDLGKNYEHVRILATATTPENATVKLIGIDENNLEQDIIQSGWGKDAGYSIGGVNVNQVLNLKGVFDKAGDYTINFKLANRDDSDSVIAEKTVSLSVKEKPIQTTPNEEKTEQVPEENKTTEDTNKTTQVAKTEEMPKKLPKTGINLYGTSILVLAILGVCYIAISKK